MSVEECVRLEEHTDRVIEARRPDIVVVDKRNFETVIIDIAVVWEI